MRTFFSWLLALTLFMAPLAPMAPAWAEAQQEAEETTTETKAPDMAVLENIIKQWVEAHAATIAATATTYIAQHSEQVLAALMQALQALMAQVQAVLANMQAPAAGDAEPQAQPVTEGT